MAYYFYSVARDRGWARTCETGVRAGLDLRASQRTHRGGLPGSAATVNTALWLTNGVQDGLSDSFRF